MQNKNGFFSNWIVKNLLLALVLIAALVLLVNIILGIVTQHGKEISVPDLPICLLRKPAQRRYMPV